VRLLNNQLYLEVEDFVALGYSAGTVKANISAQRPSWRGIVSEKDPSNGQRRVYPYASFPQDWKKQIREKLTEGEEPLAWMLKREQFAVLRQYLPAVPAEDVKALRGFRIQREATDLNTGEVLTKELSGLPEDKIKEYGQACRWLAFLSDPRWKKKAERVKVNPLFAAMPEFINACVVLYSEDEVKLPKNYSKLQAKLREYHAQGAACLVSKAYGNTVSRKVGDEQLEYLIKLYSDKRKPSFEQVTAWYNEAAMRRPELGLDLWPEITAGTSKNNLLATDVQPVWWMARHGFDSWKAKFEYTMLCFRPSQRDIQWVIDGTKVNKRYRTAKGVSAKLKMLVVMDVASEYFLGWAFAEKEDATEVAKAVRMAHRRAGGARPYQFLYDNDSSNKLFFKGVAGLHYPAMPYNGQSKTIEGAFKRLQMGIMRADVNHTGQNIKARSLNSQENTDGLKVSELPTLAECIAQAELELHQWNNYKGRKGDKPSPKELYFSSENQHQQFLSEQDEVDAFWQWNDQAITYRRDGLRFKKQGVECVYEVVEEVASDIPGITQLIPDLAFHSRFVGQRFYVKYDPDNVGEKIALYVGEDRRFVEFAHAKQAMPRAVADYQAGSRAAINVRLEVKKKQAAQVMGKQADITERLDAEDILKLGHRFLSKDVEAAAEEDFQVAQEVAVAPRALPRVAATKTQVADEDTLRRARWARMQAQSTDD
jgi:transposase InsO family protein